MSQKDRVDATSAKFRENVAPGFSLRCRGGFKTRPCEDILNLIDLVGRASEPAIL
jgi:hypothetical protein